VDDESEAMQLVLETLFDIRVAVYEVRDYLLEDDDEPEEEEEEDTWGAGGRSRAPRDLTRRLEEMIDRLRSVNAEKRRRREAEAS